MKSRDAVVIGRSRASSQSRRRAKSSACLRRVTGAHVEPKVAVYSAMRGRSGRAGRLSTPPRRRTNGAADWVSTAPSISVSMTLYYVSLALPATMARPARRVSVVPNEDDFRVAMREVVARSGRSMRALSAEMGRDPGYIAALLDPSRPSRARPTPADLVAASDATGISFVELLEKLWGIEPARLARELRRIGNTP